MTARYDAIVAGAGPAGSTAAALLARAGRKVCVLEKDEHPRFHIGESILPACADMVRELGLEAKLAAMPHMPKYGAEFAFGNDERSLTFAFSDGLFPGQVIFNVERALFDRLLLDHARECGAEILERTPVKSIERLADGDVAVTTPRGTIEAKVLLDGSGHGTVVGRHLGTRRTFRQPALQKVAYFEHFEGVEHLAGAEHGHPGIIMCDEGWFWLIALNPTRTSVGFVTHPSFVRTLDVPPERLLAWAVERCPVVRKRMRHATGPTTNRILSDFSYTCEPHAGPGYFMIGDAACFLDPIFSTGVTLAMTGAARAARHAIGIMEGTANAERARREYRRFVHGSTSIFWRLIKDYYRHSFRELFMNGTGPLEMHRAVISILAGQVFPRPVWALRWRMALFTLCVRAQRFVPLVRRWPHASLLADDARTALPRASPLPST